LFSKKKINPEGALEGEGDDENIPIMGDLSDVDGEQKDEPAVVKTEQDDAPKAKKNFWGATIVEYIDPPMPDIGMKVDFDKLLNRKYNVKTAMKMMFQVVNKDTLDSSEKAVAIPVSNMIERIKVTEPIVDLINMRKTKKEDRQYVKDNLLESQVYLSLRRSTLNMMNHNYNDKIVQKLDSIHTKEARTKMKFHSESHLNDEDDDSYSDDDNIGRVM